MNIDTAKNWSDFLNVVVSMYRDGATEREIGERFSGREVIWSGQIVKLSLTRKFSQGIDLSMGTLKFPIDQTAYLRADHVVLQFRDDVPDAWHRCSEGDLVMFRARFKENNGVMPAIGLSEFNNKTKIVLKLGLRNAELIEVVSG